MVFLDSGQAFECRGKHAQRSRRSTGSDPRRFGTSTGMGTRCVSVLVMVRPVESIADHSGCEPIATALFREIA